MILLISGHSFRYELENICRLFFPFEKIEVRDDNDGETEPDGDFISTVRERTDGAARLCVTVNVCGNRRTAVRTVSGADIAPDGDGAGKCGFDDECERLFAVMMYEMLSDITGIKPKWGILTGVRPGKLMRRIADSRGEEYARRHFSEKLLVSDEKIDLCLAASESEQEIIALSRPDSFSLYVSVPFCPTRCSYCSFVSHSIEQAGKLIAPYVELVCREIAYTGDIARRLGLHLETVYIGGGTPTSISAEQITDIMTAINRSFDMSSCREFTVEAGRPDTVTDAKLTAIKENGATRISINPQTMCDAVLKNIGRCHTAEQTEQAFYAARRHGFDNINMDLIAGLPGDTYETFCATLDRIAALDPESVTVHTLSMKRSSRMTCGGDLPDAEVGRLADEMLRRARSSLESSGLRPYYLYRQSRTVGNLENTGYAKRGCEGLYNIYIMDETHSILACGASAVTKLRASDGYIERIFNYKYPYEYISRFEEMINRKDGIEKFYSNRPITY